MFCLVLRYLASVAHQAKALQRSLPELRRWAAILLHTFQFDNTSAQGPSKCAQVVSVSLTMADEPGDERKHAHIQSSGSFKDSKQDCT